jgi:hypothetical protein
MPVDERRVWSSQVLAEVVARVRPTSLDVFEVHAGSRYLDSGLSAGLLQLDCKIVNPVSGLRLGEQLAFYGNAGWS